MSAMSFLFRAGRMTVLMPACLAASIFSLSPPMGSTSPRSVISPVMATSGRVGFCSSRLTSDVNIATPAQGPSLGTAPAGTWMWKSDLANCFGSILSRLALALTTGEGRLGAFLHHVADLAGQRQVALAGHGGLDEEHLAADGRIGQAGRHARDAGPQGQLGLVPERAEDSARGPSYRSSVSSCPLAISVATARQTDAICRSRLRTPASRV